MMFLIFLLALISLITISSHTNFNIQGDPSFFTPFVISQIRWYCLSFLTIISVAALDYRKLKDLGWVFYGFILMLLVGVLFAPAIQNVHRWFRIPGIGISIQPAELSKIAVVIALSSFLEHRSRQISELNVCLKALMITLVPFWLILREPDLGTALVLLPITVGILYFAGAHKKTVYSLSLMGAVFFLIVILLFLGFIDVEQIVHMTKGLLKEYQLKRLDPNTYHQNASKLAISLGGVWGQGWYQGPYAGQGWLPEAHTDSIFPSFVEEFGFIGASFLMLLFYRMLAFGFQTCSAACDNFGRFLAAGVTVYLAAHMIINIGMMSGLLPITGVPLPFVSYGGSSLIVTSVAVGLLQSIYARRYMF